MKKIKLDQVELRSPSFDRFPFLLCVHVYYPTETDHEAMGQRQRTEHHGKVILSLLFFFFFAVIHPTYKHSLRKESTLKDPMDDLELFDDQRQKSARVI